MFDRLLKLYIYGQIDEPTLDMAVKQRWITEEEKQKIINSRVV